MNSDASQDTIMLSGVSLDFHIMLVYVPQSDNKNEGMPTTWQIYLAPCGPHIKHKNALQALSRLYSDHRFIFLMDIASKMPVSCGPFALKTSDS